MIYYVNELSSFCSKLVVLGAFENMGFVANTAVMVLYFKYVMQFDISASANTLTNFMGSVTLLSLLGGFISDTYLNRLNTCLIFGTMEILVILVTVNLSVSLFHSFNLYLI